MKVKQTKNLNHNCLRNEEKKMKSRLQWTLQVHEVCSLKLFVILTFENWFDDFHLFVVAQTSKLQWTSLSVFTVFRDVVTKVQKKLMHLEKKIILLTHQNGAIYNSVLGHGLKKKIKVVLIKYLQTIIMIKY